MRKRVRMFAALCLLFLLGIVLFAYDDRKVKFRLDDDKGMHLLLISEERTKVLYPWLDEEEDIYYFFIPSFIKQNNLFFEPGWEIIRGKITINEKAVGWGTPFEWEEGKVYELRVSDGSDGETQLYHISFWRSQNLPAVFIETKSGSMEYIHSDKNNREKGFMDIIQEDGSINYCGNLDKISGRGNSTWWYEKKPYALTLQGKYSLCGMGKSDKWVLLALSMEGSKMNNKLIYDIAKELGLAYTTDAVWVDLYLNGEYKGIYLLNETVNKAVTDTSAEYLLEIDNAWYLDEDNVFHTTAGNVFKIHEPKSISLEETACISDYIQQIEEMIMNGDVEYKEYLDLNSFVKRFLVDEISINIDASHTSTFFYKNKGDDRLYSGPIWDYDKTLGECNTLSNEKFTMSVNYRSIVNDYLTASCWQLYLYEDTEFQEKLREYYGELLPYMEDVLDRRIDEYADWIEASVYIDSIRWKNDMDGYRRNYPGHYTSWENSVRYVKYFLVNRLNYLNQLWDIPYKEFEVFGNGELHTVFFIKNGEVIEMRQIWDGDTIERPPYLGEEYLGWFYDFSGEPYREQIPIYEDTTFYAEVKGD